MNALDFVSWLMSAVTIVGIYLIGIKWRWFWLLTLGNQVLWFYWTVATENWGLIPMEVAYTIIAARNHFLWNPGHGAAVRTLLFKRG